MNPSQPSEEAIFEAALRCETPQARAAYLDHACVGNPSLRQRIERLLAAHEQTDALLGSGETTQGPTVRLKLPAQEKPGDRIGPYKLREKIGEGGCGVVYVADQEAPMKRRVALKVVKLGMDTRQVVARFEAERQALALMDHPNIATVLDAGATSTGRPFFVMELVRGIKITDYCDENHLTTEERLHLFIQVCQAVQHAHQKGIIHRDLKPSNVLVTLHDAKPVPKVIDFGIAKATTNQRLTDKTIYTAFEQFMGTPAYMSPEQAQMSGLDIDTRSDIYSLGVLLYELLTGRTPFDAKTLLQSGLDQMRRIIREQEPPRPSTKLSALAQADLTSVANYRCAEPPKLINAVRDDLDWIVMKCLEKDRTRRYESASGLAKEIQKHLEHEPIEARPPSVWYRLHRIFLRNKLAVAGGTAIAVTAFVGLTIAVLLMQAKTTALQRALVAEKAKTRLQLELESTDMMARAQAFHEKLSGDGFDTNSWSRLPEMESLYRKALQIRTNLYGANHPSVLEALTKLSETLGYHAPDPETRVEIEAIDRQIVQLTSVLHGPKRDRTVKALEDLAMALDPGQWWPDSFTDWQRGQTTDPGRFSMDAMWRWLDDLPRQYKDEFHRFYVEPARLAELEGTYREILRVRSSLPGKDLISSLLAIRGLADALTRQSKWAEAETVRRDALRFVKSFHDEIRHEAEMLSRSMTQVSYIRSAISDSEGEPIAQTTNLAVVLVGEGKLADTEAAYREVAKDEGPRNWYYRDVGLLNLITVLLEEGKLADAEMSGEKLLQLRQARDGSNSLRVASAYRTLGKIQADRGKTAESELALNSVLAIERRGPSADSWQIRFAFGNLLANGMASEAEKLVDQFLASELNFTNAQSGTYSRAHLLQDRGEFRAKSGRLEEAAADFTRAATLLGGPGPGTWGKLAALCAGSTNCRSYLHQLKAARFDGHHDDCRAYLLLGVPGTNFKLACSNAVFWSTNWWRVQDFGGYMLANKWRSGEVGLTPAYGPNLVFDFSWQQGLMALAEYREEHFAEALEFAEKSCKYVVSADTLAVLAMAQVKTGRANEAGSSLNRAIEVEQRMSNDYWDEKLLAQILIREARLLIEGKSQER